MKPSNLHLFINGAIFTSDTSHPHADSMAVRNGRILWVGDKDAMPSEYASLLAAHPTGDEAGHFAVTDLGGRQVIPGFVDAHMHPVMLADLTNQIAVMPPAITSMDDLAAAIRERRSRQKPGQWILGWGYDEQGFLEKRSPNRYDLDRGCDDAPVMITRTCVHIRCVNSAALRLAGIDRNTPDPPGGMIERDENGEPTGILKENARNLIMPFLPEISEEDRIRNLLDLGTLLSSQGITSICDMGNLDGGDMMPVYEAAARRGFHQQTGVYYMWDLFCDDPDFSITKEKADRSRQIFAAGLKLIGDGSVSGRTAWMDKPYLGSEDEYGLQVADDKLIHSAVRFCRENRLQLSVHAMGGRTIRHILDCVSSEAPWTPNTIPHVRIEHVTDPSLESIRDAVSHGIAFVTQPIFLFAESASYIKNLGTDWTKKCYPVRTMLENGMRPAFSTDAPSTFWATPSDPLPGLQFAVTRTAADGTDCGKDEAIDMETAVTLYTRDAAMAAGFPDTGMLAPGYRADFAVLSSDIFHIPPHELSQITVKETWIGGERVYAAPDLIS